VPGRRRPVGTVRRRQAELGMSAATEEEARDGRRLRYGWAAVVAEEAEAEAEAGAEEDEGWQ